MESSDISTYALGNLLDALHHRPNSCNAKKRDSSDQKKRRSSGKRRKSKDKYSSNKRLSTSIYIIIIGRQASVQNTETQEVDKPLTTREVMEIMNSQIHNIRTEFLWVIKDLVESNLF